MLWNHEYGTAARASERTAQRFHRITKNSKTKLPILSFLKDSLSYLTFAAALNKSKGG